MSCKCKAMLKEYADWCKQNTSRQNYYLNFNVAILDQKRNFVSHISNKDTTDNSGYFVNANKVKQMTLVNNVLKGTGLQLFSDRLYEEKKPAPPPPPPTSDDSPVVNFNYNAMFRFNAYSADIVEVEIDIETAVLTLNIITWGVQWRARMRCANGMLYGFFDPPDSNGVMISFIKSVYSGPR